MKNSCHRTFKENRYSTYQFHFKSTCKQSLSMYIHESVKLDIWNTCTIHFLWNHHIPVSFIWQRVTVQCVLITDHVSTYTIYHYIDVKIGNQGRTIRIGFDSKTSTGIENSHSFTDSAYRMSDHLGNTGTSHCLHYHFTYYPALKIRILRHIVHNLDQNCLGYI